MSIKRDKLTGYKLLLAKKIDLNSNELVGNETIAVDTVSAGIGDRVLIFKEGGSAKIILKSDSAHVAQIIVGVIDEVNLDNWERI